MDELIAKMEAWGRFEQALDDDGPLPPAPPSWDYYEIVCALRASAERERELREALEDIEQNTERSMLLVGFAHGAPTRQELQDRLDAIQACARSILNKHKEKANDGI